jgi:DNA-binding protein YbaB
MPPALSRAELKSAVEEALRDNREWLRDLIQEALEEAAGAEERREQKIRAALQASPRSLPAARGQA